MTNQICPKIIHAVIDAEGTAVFFGEDEIGYDMCNDHINESIMTGEEPDAKNWIIRSYSLIAEKPKMPLGLTPAQQGIFALSGGKRTVPVEKTKADGFCGVCDEVVDYSSKNMFYCRNCQSYTHIFDSYRERGQIQSSWDDVD